MELTDKDLIEAIQSGDPQKRDWALYRFYADQGLRSWVIRYVQDHGGNQDDGEDIFQEAICLLDRNIRQGRFEGKSTLKTYFLAIAKWSWVSFSRKHRKWSELQPGQGDGESDSVEAQVFTNEKKSLLEMAIRQLDERCQELLRYYKMDYSMKEIQSILEFSSPEMAKKQAYRCRERLRKVFFENPTLLKELNIHTGNG